jgi:predicted O-methyltransferase YrrM
MQVSEEFSTLLHLYQHLQPRNVLEIGTAKGGTLFAFTALAGPGARIISVDLPTDTYGGGGYFLARRWAMYAQFAHASQRLHLLRSDSHLPATLDKVRGLLQGELLDFLFIDGDHSYEGVRADHEMYSPLVRPGGVIAFHDIVGHSVQRVGGVPRFWHELRQGREFVELVQSADQDGFGIGVLRQGPRPVLATGQSPCQPD